ncbi:LysR family transcriptional regulator [Herbaspirillum rhizosphaerae]|uniref:LysR family transcriptional regulator n=1 Tax=Herbaspirillum rhizosphaerae TaxID=346179 RepID=UPI00067E0F26|nr:LysR family transcriptional regulator [Herbaspirillum rhizosphaerae]
MTFDLRQLTAFTTIVATGSLGRSADALHVTQPALSRTIKRLEEQVGAPLFERHSKGMQLTAIGKALLPHATLLLREARHAAEEIDAMRGLVKGTIRVGAVGSIASMVLPLAIGEVLKKHPTLQVQVIEGVWDRLTDALITHEVDLALGMAVADTEEICAIGDCRWEDTSYVVAAADHPLRSKKKLALIDTLSQPWALPPQGTGPYEQMQQVFHDHGLPMPDSAVETRSVMVLKSLVTRSGFLSWMPAPMFEVDRKAQLITALEIEGATGTRTLTAFRRRHGILPGPAVRLLEELRVLTVTT